MEGVFYHIEVIKCNNKNFNNNVTKEEEEEKQNEETFIERQPNELIIFGNLINGQEYQFKVTARWKGCISRCSDVSKKVKPSHGELIETWNIHGKFHSCHVLPSGNKLVTTGSDNQLRLWSMHSDNLSGK